MGIHTFAKFIAPASHRAGIAPCQHRSDGPDEVPSTMISIAPGSHRRRPEHDEHRSSIGLKNGKKYRDRASIVPCWAQFIVLVHRTGSCWHALFAPQYDVLSGSHRTVLIIVPVKIIVLRTILIYNSNTTIRENAPAAVQLSALVTGAGLFYGTWHRNWKNGPDFYQKKKFSV